MSADQQKKPLTIVLDRSPEVAEQQRIIDQLREESIKDKELIKKYMAIEAEKERVAAERTNNPPPAPTYLETAPLNPPERRHAFDIKDSEIEPSWIKGSNALEVVNLVNKCAKDAANKEVFQKIQGKLLKKALNSPKPLDIVFQGSSKDFLKSPLPTNEFEDETSRKKKESYNERLRQNRCNWKGID